LTQKLLHIRWSVSPTINLVPKRFCVSDKTFPVTKAQKLLITNNWRLYCWRILCGCEGFLRGPCPWDGSL